MTGPDPSDPVAPGLPRSFGDYELLEEIGRGGMGVIYKARQCCLNRLCAVKMLHDAGGCCTPEAEASLRAEAAAAGALDHPNIVAIYEVGREENQLFFSMEYVEGPDLARYARASLLDARAVATLTRKIAEAIAYAHGRGVMHHDLKPANVVIDPAGEPQITDFGLARRVDDARRTDPTRGAGSPNFLSPEQASERFGDPGFPTDVFGIGAILYFLLTDRPPFQGFTADDTIRAVLETDPVRPRLLRPGVSIDLETICLRCLAKMPARRYASVREVAEELGRFLEDKPIRARPAGLLERGRKLCRRHPVVAALVSVVALLLVLIAAGSSAAALRIHQARQRAEASELTTRRHLYSADMLLASAALNEGDEARVGAIVRDHLPADHEPDLRGWEWRFLQQASRGDTDGLLGRHETAVAQIEMTLDGTHAVAADSEGTLKTWNLATGRQTASRSLARIGAPIFAMARRHDWLVTVARGATGTHHSARLLDLPALEPVREIPLPYRVIAGAFSPEDDQAWFLSADAVLAADVASGRILRELAIPGTGRARDFAFSPDGTLLARAEVTGGITLWRLEDATRAGSLPGHTAHPIWGPACSALRFSPDGRHLVSAGNDGHARVWAVAERRLVRDIAGHADLVMAVALSPDGSRVLSGGRDGFLQLTSLDSDEPPLRLRGAPSVQSAVAFLPDGRTPVSGSLDGSIQRWRQQPRAAAPWLTRLPPTTVFAVPLPDGRHFVAYQGDQLETGLSIHRLPDGKVLFEEQGITNLVAGTVGLLPDGRLLLAKLTADGVLTARECSATGEPAPTGRRIQLDLARPLSRTTDGVVVLDPTGRTLAVADSLNGVYTHDARTLARQSVLDARPRVLVVSPSGRWLAAGEMAGPVFLRRLPDLAPGTGTDAIHHPQLAQLAFSADETQLATIAFDGSARIWDTASGVERARLSSSAGNLYAVLWSRDASRLFVGSLNGMIAAWDLETGRETFLQRGHSQPVTGLVFDPEETLLSFGPDGVRAWPAPRLTDPQPPPGP